MISPVIFAGALPHEPHPGDGADLAFADVLPLLMLSEWCQSTVHYISRLTIMFD